MTPKLDRLDHLVLTVRDLAASREFYTRVLGMEARAGRGPVAPHFGDQKLHLHQAGSEFEPKSARPTPGSGDLCFTTRSPIETVVAELREAGVTFFARPEKLSGGSAAFASPLHASREPAASPNPKERRVLGRRSRTVILVMIISIVSLRGSRPAVCLTRWWA